MAQGSSETTDDESDQMPVENGLRRSLELHNGHWGDTVKSNTPSAEVLRPDVNFEPRTPQSSRSRRGSDSETARPTVKRFFKHSRSHTEAYGSGHHPLGSPSCSSPSFGHAGITRPHLNRLVSALESSDGQREDDSRASDQGTPAEDINERVVLVHKVSNVQLLTTCTVKVDWHRSGATQRFTCWCCLEIRYPHGGPSWSKSYVDLRLHPSSQSSLHTSGESHTLPSDHPSLPLRR